MRPTVKRETNKKLNVLVEICMFCKKTDTLANEPIMGVRCAFSAPGSLFVRRKKPPSPILDRLGEAQHSACTNVS